MYLYEDGISRLIMGDFRASWLQMTAREARDSSRFLASLLGQTSIIHSLSPPSFLHCIACVTT